jgi:hypothetical protein
MPTEKTKKRTNTRKKSRTVDIENDSDTTTTEEPTTTTTGSVHTSKTSGAQRTIPGHPGTISDQPGTVENKREKLNKATASIEPGKSAPGKESKSTVKPDPAADTEAFKKDPAPFLETHFVSFGGINWGSLPTATDYLLFQMKPQQPHSDDRTKDDLFVVTRDSRYVLDVEFPAATFMPQYDNTLQLNLVIREKVPDTGVRYLKWMGNRLTAMFLDEDATWVFTGPLQGCHVYVAELEDGGTVLLHANANEVTNEADNEKAKDDKASAFLAPLKGRVTHRLARRDYASRVPGIVYNGFVAGRKNPDKTWSFSYYVIYLNEAKSITGRRLQDLPLAI